MDTHGEGDVVVDVKEVPPRNLHWVMVPFPLLSHLYLTLHSVLYAHVKLMAMTYIAVYGVSHTLSPCSPLSPDIPSSCLLAL